MANLASKRFNPAIHLISFLFQELDFQRVSTQFEVFLSFPEHIASQVHCSAERLFTGLVFSCNIKGGSMIRGGTDYFEARSKIDSCIK
jgi:hypothetical protein